MALPLIISMMNKAMRWKIVVMKAEFNVRAHRYNPITTEQNYNKQISKCQKHLQTTTHE